MSQNVWPERVKAGSDLIYTISVRNNGPEQATNVLLSDTLPAEMNLLSLAPSQGTCSESGGIISCFLGSVAVDSSAGITISGTLASTSSGTISNTASVTSSESDPNMADNASTQSIALGGSILVANFMNGNNAFLASRIYLVNPSSSAGTVAVRVFTLGHEGASSLLGTVDLGTLEATSARNIKLAEDILAPLEIPLPYTDNGGNLTLEFTIGVSGVHGTAQVFNHALSLGTYQLQGIPLTSSEGPTTLVANFTNGNNAFLASRVYLWNPSSSAGKVTARLYTLERQGTSSLLGTADLGTLEASTARYVKVAEDILASLGIQLPYTDNGGNLTVELTIDAPGVRGAAQVFDNSLTFTFGTHPMKVIE